VLISIEAVGISVVVVGNSAEVEDVDMVKFVPATGLGATTGFSVAVVDEAWGILLARLAVVNASGKLLVKLFDVSAAGWDIAVETGDAEVMEPLNASISKPERGHKHEQ
jgi:hypothetical protein